MKMPLACFCGAPQWQTLFAYDAPPPGEVRFQASADGRYHREVWRCERCGHGRAVHNLPLEALYAGDYTSANYGDDEGIRRAFDRINALDPAQSDNVGRVRRVSDFAARHFGDTFADHRKILDVGSGLCVFLHRLKAAGWQGTALDPEPRYARHARDVVGVEAVCGDFSTTGHLGIFDVIVFNKVLEHVPDPIAMLGAAVTQVQSGGFIYVEVPDAEMAAPDGPEREEFFVDHWHIFSAASLALLAARAGCVLRALERLKEPSGKYTLRAFLVPAARVAAQDVAPHEVVHAIRR